MFIIAPDKVLDFVLTDKVLDFVLTDAGVCFPTLTSLKYKYLNSTICLGNFSGDFKLYGVLAVLSLIGLKYQNAMYW